MADIVDSATRSRMMAGIGPAHTAPEMRVRRYLHAVGVRFRLHDKRLPGRPDIVLPAYKTAVFVHGCFWHRHPGCNLTTNPSTNTLFWAQKFDRNVERDQRKAGALRALGWRVLVIWECETQEEDALEALFWRVVARSD